MAKKKEAQEPAGKKQEPAGKKQAVRRKKQELKEGCEACQKACKEACQEYMKDVKPFELCIVFAEGDNLDMIAKQLTGHSYMAFNVCEYSGVKYQDVRPGTILKWPMR